MLSYWLFPYFYTIFIITIIIRFVSPELKLDPGFVLEFVTFGIGVIDANFWSGGKK